MVIAMSPKMSKEGRQEVMESYKRAMGDSNGKVDDATIKRDRERYRKFIASTRNVWMDSKVQK